MLHLRQLVLVITSCLSLATVSCSHDPSRSSGDGAAARTLNAPESAALSAPPPGPWRLAPASELSHVVLWLSHVLIRHDRAPYSSVSFQLSDWHWPGPLPTRSRADALRLALQLRERAARAPERFGELAREFSEDPATRESAGFIGGISADQLTIEPSLLDALQAAHVGDVLPVVETRWGFHVLLWNQPPPLETLSGSRIIIGHQQAPWLGISYMARGAVVHRSREDAWALATRIYEQARREPERFDELVQTYSEHLDATRGGDFGSWSSREPTQFPRELATLRGLQPGEIAPPLDSLFGFQIIRRTANRPRTVYHMAAIRMPFSVKAPPESPNSARRVLDEIRSRYAEIRRDPARFDQLREEGCCIKVSEVIEGRQPDILVSTLERLAPGEIAPEPLEYGPTYMIVKLLDRDVRAPEASAQLELPAPEVELAR